MVVLQTAFDLTPWIGIFIAIGMGIVAGAFIGAITLRLSGIYFALAMLCYPMAIIYLLEYLGLQELTVPMKRDQAFLSCSSKMSAVMPFYPSAFLRALC